MLQLGISWMHHLWPCLFWRWAFSGQNFLNLIVYGWAFSNSSVFSLWKKSKNVSHKSWNSILPVSCIFLEVAQAMRHLPLHTPKIWLSIVCEVSDSVLHSPSDFWAEPADLQDEPAGHPLWILVWFWDCFRVHKRRKDRRECSYSTCQLNFDHLMREKRRKQDQLSKYLHVLTSEFDSWPRFSSINLLSNHHFWFLTA